MNHQQTLADFSFAFKPPPSEGGGGVEQQQQQHTATTPPGLSTLSNTSSISTCDEATTAINNNNNSNMVPLEMESRSLATNMNDKMMQQQNNLQQKRGPKKMAKAFGKKIGGAFQKINVAKWIDQLEQDQELADHLDRINSDTADEQERQLIRQQAHDACLQAMKDHLLEFLSAQPQATYEEWICLLHPDNINTHLDGLTNIPLIDHRFYVTDSDHRILWNEHLNDLENPTNMTPIRHYVAARSFMANTNTTTNLQSAAVDGSSTTGINGNSNNHPNDNSNLISWDAQPEQHHQQNNFHNNQQTTAAVATGVDLLSL